jgi:hypothetical protein
MSETFVERRREPRFTVPTGTAQAERHLTVSVRVVDMAASGVLLSSPIPLAVGQGGRLRMRLGDEPIEANIAVRRVAAADHKHGYSVGAVFVALTETVRQAMRRFFSGAR